MNIRAYIERYGHDVLIAVEAILANRMKSFLTALGIIFGVAAVISMLAIGNGAQQEIMDQIKMVGVNNIIIEPVLSDVSSEDNSSDKKKNDATAASSTKFSRGLTLLDAESIQDVVPSVKNVCPVVSMSNSALYKGSSGKIKLEGTTNAFFNLFNINLSKGHLFANTQLAEGMPVCIIGDAVRKLFFNDEDPVGKYIKSGDVWLQVVGVIEQRNFSVSGDAETAISSTDNKIFVPVKTMLLRFLNRNLVRTSDLNKTTTGSDKKVVNTNQLDRIIVQVEETNQLASTAQVISHMLTRRHNQVQDVSVSIPELLLKQQQRTKNIFNVVLGAIAGISLIVGGIGIMNIMLASVLERIREIGTRQAIGASRKDIIIQFLAESTLISLSGGIVGIVLGVVLAQIISSVFEIKTIISALSIVVAFGVSVFTGVIFGYLPAKRAAEKDPVESLRH